MDAINNQSLNPMLDLMNPLFCKQKITVYINIDSWKFRLQNDINDSSWVNMDMYHAGIEYDDILAINTNKQ